MDAVSPLCPHCQTAILPNARFCLCCGARLPQSSPDQAHSSGLTLPGGTLLHQGAYKIETVLGQGDSGMTYRAHDTHLNRAVAIKELFPTGCHRHQRDVVPPDHWNNGLYPRLQEQFLQEGRALAHFEHPGIVRVFALFAENNTAYMVMEFLQGETLEQMIKRQGPLPEAQAVAFITKVGGALNVVHDAGLLHRDIKPDNILATTAGRLVLMDFGLSAAVTSSNDRSTRRLGTSSSQGTPGYAPLEHYGQQNEMHPASDIYALTAMLYFLLCGQAPSPAPDRVHNPKLFLSTLKPGLSAQVSAALQWGLALSQKERPQSVREFLKALRVDRAISHPTATASVVASSQQPAPTIQAQGAPFPQISPSPPPPMANAPAGISSGSTLAASASGPMVAPPHSRQQPNNKKHSSLTLQDVWPEVRQGMLRGGVIGGVGGILLGAIAGQIVQGDLWSGALRGLLVALVGAGAGGVVGLLRAQPAPSGAMLPTANIFTEALVGAGKGAAVGVGLGALLVMQSFVDGPLATPGSPHQTLFLFGLAGAIGGAIVGVIRAIPRDRGRRRSG